VASIARSLRWERTSNWRRTRVLRCPTLPQQSHAASSKNNACDSQTLCRGDGDCIWSDLTQVVRGQCRLCGTPARDYEQIVKHPLGGSILRMRTAQNRNLHWVRKIPCHPCRQPNPCRPVKAALLSSRATFVLPLVAVHGGYQVGGGCVMSHQRRIQRRTRRANVRCPAVIFAGWVTGWPARGYAW